MPSIVHAEQYQLLGKISFWWNHSTEKYTNHNIRFLPTVAKSNRYKAYIYISQQLVISMCKPGQCQTNCKCKCQSPAEATQYLDLLHA